MPSLMERIKRVLTALDMTDNLNLEDQQRLFITANNSYVTVLLSRIAFLNQLATIQ